MINLKTIRAYEKSTSKQSACCSCLNTSGVVAQQGSVSSGLGMLTDAGGSVSYSIGQAVYTEATGAGGTINQGIQQPYEIYVIGVPELAGSFSGT